jgi:rod shape-determining protein MreD
VRRVWLVPVLLAGALVLQLVVIDGLHLPSGGEPDLVLVLVVALAMAGGPVPGAVMGFAAGLCVDIAPPGTPLLGQYALIFCLAGWAAGSLGRFTRRSPLRALAVAAAVVAAAEAIAAALGKLLEPDQVSVAEIRHFLPITIAYDLVICPFALYVVILAATTRASRELAGSTLTGTGLLSVPARSQRSRHKRRTHEPRLDPAAARAGDGWVGGGPGRHPGSTRLAHRGARLHPGAGVPGSASGYLHPARIPVRPVKLKLSPGRRGAASIGNVVGSGQGRHWQSARHPGLLAGAGHQLRFGGELTGSATRRHAPAGPRQRRVRINFSAPSGGSIGAGLGTSWRMRPSRPAATGPRLRVGASRSALAPSARVSPVRSVPTVHFRTAPAPIARRPAATPKFRRTSGPLLPSALTIALATGGVLDQSTFRARRIASGAPRLRLAGRSRGLGMLGGSGHSALRTTPVRARKQPRFGYGPGMLGGSGHSALRTTPVRARKQPRFGYGPGMLGGSGHSSLRRPPPTARKQPRFGYGRRSLLAFLTRRRLGGTWLARHRAGRRSGAWLIGRRSGGQP